MEDDEGLDPNSDGTGPVASEAVVKHIEKKWKIERFSAPDTMVTFFVGTSKQKFLVHKEFAVNTSPVFEAAFNGGFEEARTQEYTMDDTSPDTFRLLVQYLYSQRVAFKSHNLDPSDDIVSCRDADQKRVCGGEEQRVLDLWVLGQRFLMPRLQNQAMDQLKRSERSCGLVRADKFRFIYENTATGSPLREYIVESLAWYRKSIRDFGSENFDNLPKELLVELAELYWRGVPGGLRLKRRNQRLSKAHHVEENQV